ncbi:hypothetical protein AAFF_G00159190 [Aldrovandia affinis]|uniref:Protein-S-isoprenylcysteine O-methyltransferase n=1 Tax=Aldrovandia affinis TaxID=143900 RepID=A0AAD7RN90_9TELE|nr:hypothetical protein AAFF_G00159190 [Aldrovandia affinis]
MAGSKLVLEGRVSITSFILGLGFVIIPFVVSVGSHIDLVFDYLNGIRGKIAIAIYLAVANGFLLLMYKGPLYQDDNAPIRREQPLKISLQSTLVAVRACFLGFTFGCGLLISFGHTTWTHFGWYMCSLSLFHYSEYLVTAVINPRTLSLDSFLLNHSVEYTVAAVSSWVEFMVEKLLIPELKQLTWFSVAGLLMNEKAQSHVLVTTGVYSYCRHPSYVGWFCWSVGTQIMLCNPVCLVGYTLASWRFFRERIEEEEITLIHFFGEDYLEYKRKVRSGLPFITGIRMGS